MAIFFFLKGVTYLLPTLHFLYKYCIILTVPRYNLTLQLIQFTPFTEIIYTDNYLLLPVCIAVAHSTLRTLIGVERRKAE